MTYLGLGSALSILGVRDAGVLEKERALLKALLPASLDDVLVMAGRSLDGGRVVPSTRHVLWLPNISVLQGDVVRIYSSVGQNRKVQGTLAGKEVTFHDIYWDRNHPVWTPERNVLVLMSIREWQTEKIV